VNPAWAGIARFPAVMGVLNATPDSFSDSGHFADTGAAVAAGIAMWESGADIVDVGGESTRPGSTPPEPAEECRRVVPVIAGLAALGVRVSVDTRHAATMRAALASGAAIVNDISGLTHDPDAASVVARAGCPVVLMHMRGEPATMTRFAHYGDIATEVKAELGARLEAAVAAGVAREAIALDPGIGFAKTGAGNIALLPRLNELLAFGRPLVVGVSRKAFIGRLSGVAEPARRVAGSLAAGLFAVSRGAAVLRVHDVAETVQALAVWRALASGGTT
jgi:dihydropteroate synthase